MELCVVRIVPAMAEHGPCVARLVRLTITSDQVWSKCLLMVDVAHAPARLPRRQTEHLPPCSMMRGSKVCACMCVGGEGGRALKAETQRTSRTHALHKKSYMIRWHWAAQLHDFTAHNVQVGAHGRAVPRRGCWSAVPGPFLPAASPPPPPSARQGEASLLWRCAAPRSPTVHDNFGFRGVSRMCAPGGTTAAVYCRCTAAGSPAYGVEALQLLRREACPVPQRPQRGLGPLGARVLGWQANHAVVDGGLEGGQGGREAAADAQSW